MSKILKNFFVFITIFSVYHLIRDLLQNFGIENLATDILKMEKNWCSYYCNWITFPMEIFVSIGSGVILKRNKIGHLGKLVLLTFAVWTGFFLYDYFIFN